ncbi:MAG: ferric reductase-like transmembrane domain-containing protein [Anaerolineae bacterium]|nr:ferric reductase-like transmembrane domain-containing protein [Anaerolineae bacterium]
MRVKLWLQGAFWIVVYLFLAAAPLIILLIGPIPPGREFWRELSVALGFGGLAMMALQFVLTARFQVVKAPYGSDVIYHFHRQISLVALGLILAHPLLLFINAPDTLRLLNIFTAPWRARAGVLAFLSLTALIVASLWRRRLQIEYTRWRIWHGILATAAVSLAMAHVVLAGHYVNTPWKQVLWIGYGLFWIGLLAYVRLIKPILMLRRPYSVEQVIQERGNAWTLVVKPVGHAGIKFMPGQFAWLTAWQSPFSDAEHPFSFSSSACQQERLAFTIKELGDFTRTIKDLQPGQRVYLDGPFGAFSVDRHPHAQGYIFIAGGVGITPIMSILRTLADRGDRRPLLLIYANNRWEDVIFRDEFDALQQQLNLRVVHVLRDPPEGWQGEQGFVGRELLARYLPPERKRNTYETFICGPKPLMDAVEKALTELGVSLGDFHSERFDLV